MQYSEFLQTESKIVTESMLVALNDLRDTFGEEPDIELPPAYSVLRPGSTGCVDGKTSVSLHSSDTSGLSSKPIAEIIPLLDTVEGKTVVNTTDHSKILSFTGGPLIPVLLVKGKLSCLVQNTLDAAKCDNRDWISALKFDNSKTILASREHPFVFKANPDVTTPAVDFVTGSIIDLFGGTIDLTITDALENQVGVGAPFEMDQVARVTLKETNLDYDGYIYNIVVASPEKAQKLVKDYSTDGVVPNRNDLRNIIFELAAEAKGNDKIFGLDLQNLIMVNEGIFSGTLNLQLKFSIKEGERRISKRIPPKMVFRQATRI